MAVDVTEVPRWWSIDGVGHVLVSMCTCGECEDAQVALCGLRSVKAGEIGTEVPGRVCSVCRRQLDTPTLRIGASRTVKMPPADVFEVTKVGVIEARDLPSLMAMVGTLRRSEGPKDN